jgi:hypothetical protein
MCGSAVGAEKFVVGRDPGVELDDSRFGFRDCDPHADDRVERDKYRVGD